MFIYIFVPFSDQMKQIHLASDKAEHKQYNIQSIHDCDWSNPEALLDVLESSHHHQGFPLTKQGVRGDQGIQFASALCS